MKKIGDNAVPTVTPEQHRLTFILQSKYLLKIRNVRPSQWRKQIAESFLASKVGNADEFVETWERLEKEGLLN